MYWNVIYVTCGRYYVLLQLHLTLFHKGQLRIFSIFSNKAPAKKKNIVSMRFYKCCSILIAIIHYLIYDDLSFHAGIPIHLDKRWKLIWDKVQNERTHEHYQQVIYNKYNTNVINVEELDGFWPASGPKYLEITQRNEESLVDARRAFY